ncbi:hypothetical protein GTV32_22950 [Gordonia sp. SID5947]|uniref:hypothetical protein n=1 Tax=Gordonia sp. SID5947 TaxID=2690315 RepID=UPI001370275B|nr:hypothetical protein [Gordonia sp. SID5947]MYR08994.1 hypothetical protein [Gordonia sp. SID5947]
MNSTRTLARAAVTAVLAAALGAGLVACGTSGDPVPTTQQAPAQQWNPGDEPADTTETTTTEPSVAPPTAATTLPADAAQVDRTDAAAVASTVTRVWFTWDTATDTSPSDAVARSAPLLSEQFRSSVLSSRALTPSGQWLIWAAGNAEVMPTVTAGTNQGAPDTPTRRYFIFTVSQTGYGPDRSQVGSSVSRQVWVITTKGANGWEVSQLQEQP